MGCVRGLLLLLVISGLRAEVEFAGYLLGPKGALFTLAETAPAESSGWLPVGGSYRGYTIEAFDPGRETLALRYDGRRVELPLRDARVRDGRMVVEGVISVGRAARWEGVRATLYVGEETVFPLPTGVRLYLKVERPADGNLRYAARFVVPERVDGRPTERTVSAPTVVARPGQPFAVRVGELGFEFAPVVPGLR